MFEPLKNIKILDDNTVEIYEDNLDEEDKIIGQEWRKETLNKVAYQLYSSIIEQLKNPELNKYNKKGNDKTQFTEIVANMLKDKLI